MGTAVPKRLRAELSKHHTASNASASTPTASPNLAVEAHVVTRPTKAMATATMTTTTVVVITTAATAVPKRLRAELSKHHTANNASASTPTASQLAVEAHVVTRPTKAMATATMKTTTVVVLTTAATAVTTRLRA